MILDLFKLTDQVAVVTGAGRGIGRGIALAYAEAGADVVCAARTPEQVEDTAAQVRERGRRAVAVPCDVMDSDQLANLVDVALKEMGRLDVLVNNAGGTPPREALETSQHFFEQAFQFNVLSAFELTRLAVPRMLETAGGGAVVNISSRAGDLVQPAFVAYGTAKAALSFMTRQLASEWAPKVRVNAISVGAVDTSALEFVMTNEAIRRQLEENTPMGRIGRVEDVAACALYLASPAGGWVTGKVFQVDGGTEATSLHVPTKPL